MLSSWWWPWNTFVEYINQMYSYQAGMYRLEYKMRLRNLLIVKDRFCIDLKRVVKRGVRGKMETKLFKFEVVESDRAGIARASHRCWRRSHDELSVEMSQALKILVMKRNYGYDRRRTKHQALALLATTLHVYCSQRPLADGRSASCDACKTKMHLLFQELLFIEGGSAVEPVFVIIGTMWSHFYVLQKKKYESSNS